ncbi:MAG: gephyrin-like molybdotransferase Glp [Pseudomonadota bacterium]
MTKRLPDDCFALPPGVDWTPVDEALARLRDSLGPITGVERRSLAECCGRILAEPVFARRANPPATNAAVDGYAFAWASVDGKSGDLALATGRAAAGHPHGAPVSSGHTLRILTGAEVPEGADTVVMQEDVTLADGRATFPLPRKAGANTRPAGEDAKAGDEVLPAGRCLTPADLARAAAVGAAECRIRKRLRLAVLSTGDELVQPGDSAHGIFDANRPMLVALARRLGFDVLDLGAAPDDAEAIRAAFDRAAEGADALVTTGGASAGDEDHISRLLTTEGQVTTWRIAVKPGRPLALGMWRGLPVFGLPGNPVAAFVCALIFMRPALGLMAGEGWHLPQAFEVPAAFEKSKKPGRREYLRARIRDGRAEIFHSEGSGLVGGLSWAEGLVELPEPALTIRPGDPVRYLPFSSFGI